VTPALASALADAVLAAHLAFIAFAVLGGIAALRWPRIAWLHLPALAWAGWSALAAAPCPLTPLEQHLRALAGEPGYTGGFIAHYLEPLIYPPGLTRPVQGAAGVALVTANALIYAFALRRRARSTRTQTRSASR
jgi:hypothetical protein